MLDADWIVIRIVKLSDAPQLRQHCFVNNTTEQVRDRVRSTLEAYAEGRCIPLVAEVDGMVVGMATLRRNPLPMRSHRANLEEIVVSGEYFSRGIARRLVEKLHELAVPAGLTIFETSVRGGTSVEDAYHKIGFREYGRLPRGICDSRDDAEAYDEVALWMPVRAA